MRILPAITPEAPGDFAAVEALIDSAFGPGRLAKTAERLRENRKPAAGLSVVARDRENIIGCARMWDIRIGQTAALLLGPFAVKEGWRGQGLGAAMIEIACDTAQAQGHELVLLVGDAAYFSNMDFWPVERGAVRLPGPVDPHRVLVCALKDGAADGLAGEVTAA